MMCDLYTDFRQNDVNVHCYTVKVYIICVGCSEITNFAIYFYLSFHLYSLVCILVWYKLCSAVVNTSGL